MRPRPLPLVAVATAVAGAAVALWLFSPVPSGAQEDLGSLRSRADQQRAREQALSGDVARLGALVSRLERQLALLATRSAQVQAQLAADEAKLARLQAALRAERARLARLRARLAEARSVLAKRLVALYKTPETDLAIVVLKARSFADLVSQGAFMRRIRRQDQRIVRSVQAARLDAAQGVRRLTASEARQREVTNAMRARRTLLANLTQAATNRRATLVAARAARVASLQSARATRQRLESRISALEAAQARAAAAGNPGGPWSIPWSVVQCESGGQNLPPNWAGASGYYQIIPGTWRLFGGSGPAAWQASKGEQDRVAARIWNGGAGKSHWVCAGIVGI